MHVPHRGTRHNNIGEGTFKMQKKALVFAVSAAFVIPCALAQKKGGGGEEKDPDQIVELYGKLYPEVVRESGSGATPAGTRIADFAGETAPGGGNQIISRNQMESSNSRFGIRGQEKLGGGLKAIFQLETEFHVDQNDSRFARRDSFVGLSHPAWGTVKLGRMDTPFKGYADDISFLGVSSGNFTSTSEINRNLPFASNSTGRFHERAQNAVDYETPHWGGFQGEIQYSTLETDTATRKPHWWSGGIKWEGGPFEISFGYEGHWDMFGLSANVPSSMRNPTASGHSKDEAYEVMVKFKWGIHQFEIDANRKEWKENPTVTGRARSYKNNSYLAIWDMRWSPQWRTQIHYVRSTDGDCERLDAACSTEGLGGKQISAGVAYYFSKRTYLFFMAQWLKNDHSATFYTGTQADGPNIGEDVRQYAVGINHNF
jgi:predicted porin